MNDTVLNLIASDFINLQGLSEKEMIARLLEDLRQYIPELHPDDIRAVDFQPHLDEPLFMNDTGAWQFRPKARTRITNLYLAGDYCRSHIDLVCMEGAVTTGLIAAEAVRAKCGLKPPIHVLQPPEFPGWLLVLGRVALLPVAAIAKGLTMVLGTAR